MSDKVISFVDSVGRVIVAREASEKSTDSKLAVTNPSVVNINVNQESGQITVQLLPYIFREFIVAEKRFDKHTWFFNRCQITTSEDIEIDEPVVNQYIGIFETAPTPKEEQPEKAAGEAVELFDDEASSKDSESE